MKRKKETKKRNVHVTTSFEKAKIISNFLNEKGIKFTITDVDRWRYSAGQILRFAIDNYFRAQMERGILKRLRIPLCNDTA